MVKTVSQRSIHSSNLRFQWKVNGFACNGQVQSEEFYFCGFQWKLELDRLTFDRPNDPDYLSVYLKKTNSLKSYNKLSIQSFVEDCQKKPWNCREVIFNTSRESIKKVWSKWLSLKEMRDSLITYYGTLTFVFNLTFEEPVRIKEEKGVQAHLNAESESSAESLAVDFRRLLDDNTGSDVTLKSGDVTIPAHRLILSARSDVFAAMFRSDMVESRNGIVEISDIDSAVLKQLVQFIYTGKLSDLTMETAPQLFVAGEKYAIETLKLQCLAFMKSNLAEGNVCSILVLADTYSDTDLRECAISFIINSELIQMDDMWSQFYEDYPKLATEVLNLKAT